MRLRCRREARNIMRLRMFAQGLHLNSHLVYTSQMYGELNKVICVLSMPSVNLQFRTAEIFTVHTPDILLVTFER